MKSDNNPSVIFGLYSKPEKKKELLEELKKLDLGVREISFIDVEIPPERKDEVVNFFKHFVMCDYWSARNPLLRDWKIMGIDLKEKLSSKLKLKPIKFNQGDWQHDNKHKLLWTLAVPLLYQDNLEFATNEEEEKSIKDLETFTSEGYEPIIKGVVDEKDMEMINDN